MKSHNVIYLTLVSTLIFFSCEGGGGGGTAKRSTQIQPNQGQNQQQNQFNQGNRIPNWNGSGFTQETFEICAALRANSNLMNRASTEVNLLCEKIPSLRQENVIYRGETSAKVVIQGEEVPGQSNVTRATALSSIRQNNDPEYFASKVKLEVSDPAKFEADSFEMTPDRDVIEFQTISKDNDQTEFLYTNRRDPDVILKYRGKSSFHTIVPGQAYAIVSTSEEGIESVRDFRGLIVINRMKDNAGEIEIFGYTKEVLDNYGGHEDVMNKFKVKFAEEQMRGYRNGLHAKEINLNYW